MDRIHLHCGFYFENEKDLNEFCQTTSLGVLYSSSSKLHHSKLSLKRDN